MSPSEGSNGLLLTAALEYATRGWPVLPLRPRSKEPITPHGLLDATTDLNTIEAWWYANPEANIGLRTGWAFDVIDIDGPAGRDAIEAEGGLPKDGPVSITGKGWHYLVQPTLCRNGACLLPKVDFRGMNGYIVAPPSLHPKGHRYMWAPHRGPDAPIPAAPSWFFDLLTPQAEPRKYEEPIILRKINGQEVAINMPLAHDLDILDVAMRSGLNVQKRGALWKALCPFHREDTPSFTLYANAPRQSFYCFGCHAWGDALDLQQGKPAGYR